MWICAKYSHQADPWPGGHRYALIIPLQLGRPWLARHATPSSSALQDLYPNFEVWQYPEIPRGARPPELRGFRFVLNTIEGVRRTATTFELRGACSPFVPVPAAEPGEPE
jgi:hypothetical protein